MQLSSPKAFVVSIIQWFLVLNEKTLGAESDVKKGFS
ncbi:hypothetical protein HP15_p187g132 (plasmid) [Marinobacter adhaerens HP15]|uniref:Uncharacterized protein n=1 Tax=Marinobacter adhaerens (strain DSM 23420 / HP15) TaxID=225937 RepID=E4PS94_MARAH|nr:hypothetical protein HP15_p187g132 [Marinobacter adhaerens HP15]